MKKLLLLLCLVMMGTCLSAQGKKENPVKALDEVEALIEEQSYKTAYAKAETVYNSLLTLAQSNIQGYTHSASLLRAAHYMQLAAAQYQEDADDSISARYHRILYYLDTVERALCLTLLDSGVAAMRDTAMLKNIPVERARYLCTKPDEEGLNTTPTIYDLILTQYIKAHSLQETMAYRQALLAHHRRLLAEAADDKSRRTEESLVIYHEVQMLRAQEKNDYAGAIRRGLECLERCRNYKSEYLTSIYHYIASGYYYHDEMLKAKLYCDTAVKLMPKSAGGVDCYNLRNQILAPSINIWECPKTPSNEEGLFSVEYSNMETLYYRVVRKPESMDWSLKKDSLLKAEVLYENELPLPCYNDYKRHSAIGILPALPMGEYVLLASHRRDGFTGKAGFHAQTFWRTDFQIIYHRGGNYTDELIGYVLHTIDGSPVPNIRVNLLEYQATSGGKFAFVPIDSTQTDAQGRYRFNGMKKRKNKSLELQVVSGGVTMEEEPVHSHFYHPKQDDTMLNVFFDRPIYRPGDTLQFALIASYKHRDCSAGVMNGWKCRVEMKDNHYKVVDSMTVVTDAFGSASGWFVLTEEAEPGRYWLIFDGEGVVLNEEFTVEAYKQPTFTVTLKTITTAPRFNDTVYIQGLAQTYTEVPVGGATVQYTIKRNPLYFWWQRARKVNYRSSVAVVASGTATTDAEGRFRLDFIPQPDIDDPQTGSLSYGYTVNVTVTDAAGETQSQECSVRVGNDNRLLGILGISPDTGDAESLKMQYRFSDLNDNPLSGNVTLRIERLQQPLEAKLLHPAMRTGLTAPLSRDEFARRFPQYYYSIQEYADTCWPVTGNPLTIQAVVDSSDCSSSLGYLLPLPKLKAGVFRMILSTDSLADTVIYTYNPPKNNKPQGIDLLRADTDKRNYRVGETITLRIGSRHKNLHCIVAVMLGDSLTEEHFLTINDGFQTVSITATREMYYKRPNFCIYTIKQGEEKNIFYNNAYLPNAEKQLKVTLETFRNYLEPGTQEEWKINIFPSLEHPGLPGASSQQAQLILTMYDKALDSYPSGHPGWKFFTPLPYVNLYNSIFYHTWHPTHSDSWISQPQDATYKGSHAYDWTLMQYYHGRKKYKTFTGNAVRAKNPPQEAIAEIQEIVVYDEVPESPESEPSAFYLRTNSSTLAFFEPALRSDSTGCIVYRFRAPDLLTQWRIEGLAWTPDLSFGRLQKLLVTRKQLMIQPNMPRFVRQGDTIILSARVSNLTEDTLDVNVLISIPDSQRMVIPPHTTLPVTFDYPIGSLPLSQGVTSAQSIQWIATTAGHSDAVQLPLPVLPNRMTVTQSFSLYQNGPGEKRYDLPLYTSPTAEPVALTVAYTANPLWLALQSLPYLAERSDPSNIYLINSICCNTIGKILVDKYPNIDTLGNYYDREKLQAHIDKDLRTLMNAQRPDGGWSWMPQGQYSSDYVTRYILTTAANLQCSIPQVSQTPLGAFCPQFSLFNAQFSKALRYVDSLAYLRYSESLKNNTSNGLSVLTATNLDYLYTRSFYPMDVTAAANSQYSKAHAWLYQNARRHYKQVNGLYEQALLAMVLHRGGDKKEARELVRRIKEKALVTDETGMYWRDNKAGYLWHQRPVETQALLIRLFREVIPDDKESIALMQQWLLKQKQTTLWDSDIATLHAIMALIDLDASPVASTTQLSIVNPRSNSPLVIFDTVGNGTAVTIVPTSDLVGDGTAVTVNISGGTPGIPSWGAVFYQYQEDLDKIPYTSTGITCKSQIYVVCPDGTLKPVEDTILHVGMRLRRVLSFSTDRVMEYVEVCDSRAACLEPVSTASGWQWSHQKNAVPERGLSYYRAVGDDNTTCYIDRLEKGNYIIENDCYITHAGTFTLAPAILQCLYAPEFRVTTKAEIIKVK